MLANRQNVFQRQISAHNVSRIALHRGVSANLDQLVSGSEMGTLSINTNIGMSFRNSVTGIKRRI